MKKSILVFAIILLQQFAYALIFTEPIPIRDTITSRHKHSACQLPYRYEKIKDSILNQTYSMIFIPSMKQHYIIADSIFTNLNDDDLCFYFLTPLEKDINLECPQFYGLIVLNKQGQEVYKRFWDSNAWNSAFWMGKLTYAGSNISLEGNSNPGIMKFQSKQGKRNLLRMGFTGCGSGYFTAYYDIIFSNNKIDFRAAFASQSSFNCYEFYPHKNQYYKIERLNPPCHYGCQSRYQISIFSLLNDRLLRSKQTKHKYDDFNDLDLETLIKNIRLKEPAIFGSN